MAILDAELLSKRYFFPRGERVEGALEVAVTGAVLNCFASLRDEQRPVLIHFHGNGECVGDYVPEFAAALDALGLDSFFAEYRGSSGSTGKPALVEMLNDVVHLLKATGRPAAQTFVYGRSIGSIYAVHAAQVWPDLAGLIVESGIADVAERVRLRVSAAELGATESELAAELEAHLNQRAKVERYTGRMLVMHSLNDRTVDISHARRLRKWGQQAELVTFDQGDHNSILAVNLPQMLDHVRRFVFAR